MARAIVRYSLQSGERYSSASRSRSRATNAIRDTLRAAGFETVGTAAWEGTGSADVILGAVAGVVAIVKDEAPDMLDHLWLYVDASAG